MCFIYTYVISYRSELLEGVTSVITIRPTSETKVLQHVFHLTQCGRSDVSNTLSCLTAASCLFTVLV